MGDSSLRSTAPKRRGLAWHDLIMMHRTSGGDSSNGRTFYPAARSQARAIRAPASSRSSTLAVE